MTERIEPGHVFTAFHFPEVRTNLLDRAVGGRQHVVPGVQGGRGDVRAASASGLRAERSLAPEPTGPGRLDGTRRGAASMCAAVERDGAVRRGRRRGAARDPRRRRAARGHDAHARPRRGARARASSTARGSSTARAAAAPTEDLAANTVEVAGPLTARPGARRFYTTSSCGICGKGALEEVEAIAARVRGPARRSRARSSPRCPTGSRQPAFERTGGLHATGLFDAGGELLLVREDVGRHNAMDKVIGHALLEGLLPLGERVLCVSGRLAFELVQKAARAGAPILVGVGAPTSLAVQLADDRGITLAGFARRGKRERVHARRARKLTLVKRVRMGLALGVGAGLLVLPVAAGSGAGVPARAAALAWSNCGEGFQCATARVPLDYRRPGGRKIKLRLARLPARDPARTIGSLFVNPGGPGGSGIDFLRDAGKSDLAPLNARFDLVAWDPRGVGQSAGRVDCAVDQEKLGIYAQPFTRPGAVGRSAPATSNEALRAALRRRNSRSGLLPHLHTANTARDLNRLRADVGDRKLSYLGFSYGTQIGATYATLFPGRVRALALDGAVDAEGFVNNPIRDTRRQTQAYEEALSRFFAACRTRQDHCGLGPTNPRAAYDALAEQLDRQALPAPDSEHPAPVDGDDLRSATSLLLSQKQLWRCSATP